MPFRVGPIGAFASPNLPARQGISSLRHAHTPELIGGSRLRECAGCGGDCPRRRVEESEHTATHQEIDMFKQQQNEHRQQLTLGCALMTTAVLAALAPGV